jgi:hypothetical protein
MLFRTLGVLILALALSLGAASAAEARVFTLDFNDNGMLELDGSDDLPFSFCGTSGINPQPGCDGPGEGLVDGVIKAVDLFIDPSDINVAFSMGTVDFATQDVFVFEVELLSPSGSVDEIALGINTVPLFSLAGAGVLTGPGVTPGSVTVSPFVTLSANWFFTATNLLAGQTTVRLFATYNSSPVLNDTLTASFMISSGIDASFLSAIAPEPSAALLLSLAGIGAALHRRRRRS